MKLKRQLGVLQVFGIASGAMICSGVFVLPSIAFDMTGPSLVAAYALAGLLMIPSVLAKAELATAMPKAGGTYFYIERSMGSLAGTFGGTAHWFAISLESTFALIGVGALAHLVFPGMSAAEMKAIAVGGCVLVTLLNLFSTKGTTRVQTYLVWGLVVILAAYVAGGLGLGKINPDHFRNFTSKGFRGFLATTGMIFIAYGGLTKIASIAEEVRNPGRTIPRGMLLAFVLVNLIYLFVAFVTVGLLAPDDVKGTYLPVTAGARLFMGTPGAWILGVAGLVAFATTANAGLMGASRSPMAMSRDNLLPDVIHRVSRRFGTPYVAVLLTSTFMTAVILFVGVKDLVKIGATLMMVLFALTNVSLIIMRESKIAAYRPTFRVPLYPWLQVAAILAYGFLITRMGRVPIAVVSAFGMIGLAWYFAYVRMRVRRQSALIHVVERITATEIAGATLGTELLGVLRERDDIKEDRFDRIIQECDIIDLDEAITVHEFFDRIAGPLARRMETDRESVFEMLVTREAEAATVVAPGLAIPHVIVEGEGKFDILVARCRAGMKFSDSTPPVHMMFVLAGTRDERTVHLRALMSIAQIAQQRGFERHCLHAPNVEALRHVILVSERKRFAYEARWLDDETKGADGGVEDENEEQGSEGTAS